MGGYPSGTSNYSVSEIPGQRSGDVCLCVLGLDFEPAKARTAGQKPAEGSCFERKFGRKAAFRLLPGICDPGCCPESTIKPPLVHSPLETRGEQGKPHAKTGRKTRRYTISTVPTGCSELRVSWFPMGQW
jgi:hypothetical protein